MMTIRDSNCNILAHTVFRENSAPLTGIGLKNSYLILSPMEAATSYGSSKNWIKQFISHFTHPMEAGLSDWTELMEAVELNNSPEKSWLSFLTLDWLPTY